MNSSRYASRTAAASISSVASGVQEVLADRSVEQVGVLDRGRQAPQRLPEDPGERESAPSPIRAKVAEHPVQQPALELRRRIVLLPIDHHHRTYAVLLRHRSGKTTMSLVEALRRI